MQRRPQKKRNKFHTAGLVLFALCLCAAGYVVFFYYQISSETGSRIQRGAIRNVIFSESPVFYDDGQSIVGVFFEKTHRKYINYEDIPPYFIKALIASEDRNFFNHPGFDLRAIGRAFMANIRAGKVVQGGSTLTQQTAKNVFRREKRSYRAKLKELIQALLLESSYTKEEILEMYVNQFFVTGFGNGLRIAAQYYFDKEAGDLDLVESAFIAGSVKGPFRYNPFTRKTEAGKNEAIRQAKNRKDYVLRNMFLMQFITREQYEVAAKREVLFKEGKVTYKLNVILNYIRDQLETGFFKEILEEQGVYNIATSGIRIFTSINRQIQEGALKSIRNRLPFLDVKLSGYGGRDLQERYAKLTSEFVEKPKVGFPFLGRVTKLNLNQKEPHLMVSWQNGGGIIDYDGFKDMGSAWIKWKLGNWAEFDKSHATGFLKGFKAGDLVPVQIIETNESTRTRLRLTQIPDLEGGIIVLQEGKVKAMIGGFFDRFFNRAVDAKRQLGSLFKPLVYTAALQLKWNTLDPLINREDLFRFETTMYVPKPDHKPTSEEISMAWAGVHSENLATVWLLYHLTDRLNISEFRQVAQGLGLHRRADETYRDYVKRIRDKHGIVVNREALMEASFEASKKEIEADLIFAGQEKALSNLKRFHFSVDIENLDLKEKEKAGLYRLSFQRLRSLNFKMRKDMDRIKHLMALYREKKDATVEALLADARSHFYHLSNFDGSQIVVYSETPRDLEVSGQLLPFSNALIEEKSEMLEADDVWIEALMPSKSIDLLQLHMKNHYKKMLNHKRYDQEVLYHIRDFRILVNLLYVSRLSEKMGITTPLDPVLSFPLGSNAIGIIEAALAYNTIMTGKVYPLNDTRGVDVTPIITKIVDREGITLWEYKPKPKELLSKRLSLLITEVLRKVMTHGTGRQAKEAVKLNIVIDKESLNIPVPTFGKTGTANRFTNSSFVGFVPGIAEEMGEFDLEKGFVIASYVGYDDNRPMKSKHVTIYGASGALPLWIDTANAIVGSPIYLGDMRLADLAFQTDSIYADREGLAAVTLSPNSGLPLPSEGDVSIKGHPQMMSHADLTADGLELKRFFEPLSGVKDENN